MNIKVHKITSFTWNFQNFTCVFTILVNLTFIFLDSHTGSPSLKHEHQQASVLLHNIQNIRIFIEKKPIVSVTYENETISTRNSLPYLKCVLRLSCVVHGLIYGLFVGFYVNCSSLYLGFTKGLQRSGKKDPPKQNCCKFTPLTAPIASKFRLGNAQ